MAYTASVSDKVSLDSDSHELAPTSHLHTNMKVPDTSVTVEDGMAHYTSPSRNTELRRALSERHVNMIAFSTNVGVGCFLQSGKVINIIGPGGAVLAYLLTGAVLWSANSGLMEMTAVFPVKGPIIDFCGRFLDESVGFAVGWMAWFSYCVVTAAEISTFAQTFYFQFPKEYLKSQHYPDATLEWSFGVNTSASVWIGLAMLAVLLINILPVRVYGEIEHFCGWVKIVMMSFMIIFNVVISAINVNNGKTPGTFWTYSGSYGFFTNTYSVNVGDKIHSFHGATGRLFAMWTAMTTIYFSYQAFFIISVTAAENKNLEKTEGIKIASRKIALRVILLYTLLVFTVGLNVPYDDAALIDSSISAIRQGNHSPFIIACIRSGVTGLPHLFNAFFIFSAFSTSVNCLYVSSRFLHALASIRNVWPRWAYFLKIRLERTTSKGVPLAAVFTSWIFAFLSFLGTRDSASNILGRLATLSTSSTMIIYGSVATAFYVFKTRCTVEAEPSDPVALESETSGPVLNRAAATYPYRTHLQWGRTAFALCGCVMFAIFNGWKSLLSPFSAADFLASYIPLAIFIILVAGYHIKDERTWNPVHWTRRAEMNIQNPVETEEGNPLLRRGRLHRANHDQFWARENLASFGHFIWVWFK